MGCTVNQGVVLPGKMALECCCNWECVCILRGPSDSSGPCSCWRPSSMFLPLFSTLSSPARSPPPPSSLPHRSLVLSLARAPALCGSCASSTFVCPWADEVGNERGYLVEMTAQTLDVPYKMSPGQRVRLVSKYDSRTDHYGASLRDPWGIILESFFRKASMCCITSCCAVVGPHVG